MELLLVGISSVLSIGAAIPYLIDRTAQPRIVTWFVWSVLTGIACVASFADGQWASGVLTLATTIQTSAVFVFGLKRAEPTGRKLNRLDAWCLAAAMAGLVLWLLLNSPAIAIVAMIAIDITGAIPTVVHSWREPGEEKWLTYVLTGMSGGITLLATHSWTISALAYPVYLLMLYTVLVTVLLLGQRRKSMQQEADLVQ